MCFDGLLQNCWKTSLKRLWVACIGCFLDKLLGGVVDTPSLDDPVIGGILRGTAHITPPFTGAVTRGAELRNSGPRQ